MFITSRPYTHSSPKMNDFSKHAPPSSTPRCRLAWTEVGVPPGPDEKQLLWGRIKTKRNRLRGRFFTFAERLSCVEGSKQFLALSPGNSAGGDGPEPEESSWRKSFAKSISWQFPKTGESSGANDTSPTTSSSLLTPLQVQHACDLHRPFWSIVSVPTTGTQSPYDGCIFQCSITYLLSPLPTRTVSWRDANVFISNDNPISFFYRSFYVLFRSGGDNLTNRFHILKRIYDLSSSF